MHMTHIEHKPFQWIHTAGSSVNRCDLDIFLFETRALIVASEREDRGSGMSISNGAAILATIVMQKYRLHPKDVFWIEHFPEKQMGRQRIYRMAEVYQRLTFAYQRGRFVTPLWESLDNEGTRAFTEAIKTSLQPSS